MEKQKLKNIDEFVESFYDTLFLERVLDKYQTEKVPQEIIFSRFQNLERHFYNLQGKRRRDIWRYKKKVSELENLKEQSSKISEEIFSYSKKLKNLKGDREKRKELKDKLADMNKSKKSFDEEIREVISEKEKFRTQVRNRKKQLREYERDYGREMEHIYSNKIVDENFAWLRLMKPGKFRIKEPILIAQYNILQVNELFNSEYLDSTDRKKMAEHETKGHYLIPYKILEGRLKELPIRIKNLSTLIKDAEELQSKGLAEKYDKTKIYSRLQDLLYERDSLDECLKKRK